MRDRRITAVWLLGSTLAGGGLASAQAPAARHQHYERSAGPQSGPGGILAPRLQNLGAYTFPVTTNRPRAQQFINQGVNLMYGFNHAEAGRAFAEAARLDPGCAMAYWGQALAVGPNINAAMNPEDEAEAHALVQKAVSLGARATARERAYITALSARYTGKPADRARADRAFAEAMRALAKRYPRDLDAATLFAESLMDLRPWNYWTPDGVPLDGIEEAIAALRTRPRRQSQTSWRPALLDPSVGADQDAGARRTGGRSSAAADAWRRSHHSHAGAYLSPRRTLCRRRQLESARRGCRRELHRAVPGAGHLSAQLLSAQSAFHLARFDDSMAVERSRSMRRVERPRRYANATPAQLPSAQGFLVVPYFAMIRFGRWDELLAEPRPTYDSPYIRGIVHFARGAALAGKGRLDEAQKELASLRQVIADPELAKGAAFSLNAPSAILRIAPDVLAGEIAAQRKDYDMAIMHFERAVRHEDALTYNEPPDWHAPVRHWLGAVLLEAGRPVEAEVVFWEDLRRNRENGWSLFGLHQALLAQGKKDDAALAEQRFKKAWALADVTLRASRF